LTAEATQPLRALEIGNAVRTAHSQLKRDVKEGRTNVARILADPPPHAGGLRIGKLLEAAPKIGRESTSRCLNACHIDAQRKLGELTDHDKLRITVYLRNHNRGAWRVWQEQALEAAA
jgi:hypothetical protein